VATCPVCGKVVDEAAARAQTGQTMHGASEVDPTKGTRQFHDGKWYYFDTLDCRTKFMASPGAYLERTEG
jgi:YHS domain-containing protein